MSLKNQGTQTMKEQMVQKLKRFGKESNISSLNSQISMTSMKKKAARLINQKLRDETTQEEEPFRNAGYDSASQSDIPLEDIKDGIIITSDKRYVGVVEVLPLDYFKQPENEQARILNEYKQLFKNDLNKFQLKMLCDTYRPNELIEYIMENTPNVDSKEFEKSLEDYITFIYTKANISSMTVRYFIIHEYYNNNDENIKTEDEIIEAMKEKNDYIRDTMLNCGNLCIEPENPNLATMEFLYFFFNRKTSYGESLKDRTERIRLDYALYNSEANDDKKPRFVDLIAPKGLWFINRNYVWIDGLYYGFLAIDTESWPERVTPAWLTAFIDGTSRDIDVIGKRVGNGATTFLLSQFNKNISGSLNNAADKGKVEKASKLYNKLKNNVTVQEALKAGDVMYNCAVILTIRANSAKELKKQMKDTRRQFQKNNIKFDNTFLFAEDYFLMTQPFMFFTSQFSMIRHNILSSQMASFYAYTSYAMIDKKGIVLGKNSENATLFAPDNYNTGRFTNGNTCVIGKSGAGKSYTLMTMAERYALSGIKTLLILPKKGYEYKKACKNIEGVYIQLLPGTKDCINLMEIRPSAVLSKEALDESISSYQRSLLAQKIQNITAWIGLLIDVPLTNKQRKNIHVVCENIYANYGITDDNDSIYEDKQNGILKVMPTITDLYEGLLAVKNEYGVEDILDPLKEFYDGTAKNMNGQTNVDLSSHYTVFDVDEDKMDEKIFPAFMKIVFDCCYDAMKADVNQKVTLFADEVWKMMQRSDSAQQVFEAVKLVRGYGSCMVLSTQELDDFLRIEQGRSIIANSEIKILLKCDKSMVAEDSSLRELVGLTQEDCEYLIKAKHGNALFITSSEKIKILIESTKRQFRAFNTDVSKRKQIEMEEKEEQLRELEEIAKSSVSM